MSKKNETKPLKQPAVMRETENFINYMCNVLVKTTR